MASQQESHSFSGNARAPDELKWMGAALSAVSEGLAVIEGPDRIIRYHNDVFLSLLDSPEAPVSGTSLDRHLPNLSLDKLEGIPTRYVLKKTGGNAKYLELIASRCASTDQKPIVAVRIRDASSEIGSVAWINAQRAISRVFEQTHGPDTMAQALQSICESLSWKHGAYWSVDAAQELLRCEACWPTSAQPTEFETASRQATFELGKGLPGRVWQSHQPSWIEDVTKDSNFPRAAMAKKSGLHAAFCFPVVLQDQILGVLEFFNDRIEKPDPELLQTMASIGTQLGLFLQRKDAQEALSRSKQQLYQSEKLSAIGQLAAGVAHEINNPLGIILGFSQSVMRRIKEGDPMALPLKSIEREALRCKTLVQNLLTFSRQNKGQFAKIELNTVVDNILSIVEAQARMKNAKIIKELGTVGSFWGDQNKLQQVLVNLCNNAFDAMPDGGTITVRTHETGAEADRRVVIEVWDTGTGIPKEYLSKIFEPFFTTKDVGKGTGLGLSLVYEIIQMHKGTIEVQSAMGKGTTFVMTFPANPPKNSEENSPN